MALVSPGLVDEEPGQVQPLKGGEFVRASEEVANASDLLAVRADHGGRSHQTHPTDEPGVAACFPADKSERSHTMKSEYLISRRACGDFDDSLAQVSATPRNGFVGRRVARTHV